MDSGRVISKTRLISSAKILLLNTLARTTLEYYDFDVMRYKDAMIDELRKRASMKLPKPPSDSECLDILLTNLVLKTAMQKDMKQREKKKKKYHIEEEEIFAKYNQIRRDYQFDDESKYEEVLVKELLFAHDEKYTKNELQRRVAGRCPEMNELRKVLVSDAKMILIFFDSDVEQHKFDMLDEMYMRNIHNVEVDRKICEEILDEVFEKLDELQTETIAKQNAPKPYIKHGEILEKYRQLIQDYQFDNTVVYEDMLAKVLYFEKHKIYTLDEIEDRVLEFCIAANLQNIFNQFESPLQQRIFNAAKMVIEYHLFNVKNPESKQHIIDRLHNVLNKNKNVDGPITIEICELAVNKLSSRIRKIKREIRKKKKKTGKRPITDAELQKKLTEQYAIHASRAKDVVHDIFVREVFFDNYVHDYTLPEIWDRALKFLKDIGERSEDEDEDSSDTGEAGDTREAGGTREVGDNREAVDTREAGEAVNTGTSTTRPLQSISVRRHSVRDIIPQLPASLRTRMVNAAKMIVEYYKFDCQQYAEQMSKTLLCVLKKLDNRVNQAICSEMIESMATQIDSIKKEVSEKLKRKRKKKIKDSEIENNYEDVKSRFSNRTENEYININARELFFENFVNGYTFQEIQERYLEYIHHVEELEHEQPNVEVPPPRQPSKRRKLNK